MDDEKGWLTKGDFLKTLINSLINITTNNSEKLLIF